MSDLNNGGSNDGNRRRFRGSRRRTTAATFSRHRRTDESPSVKAEDSSEPRSDSRERDRPRRPTEERRGPSSSDRRDRHRRHTTQGSQRFRDRDETRSKPISREPAYPDDNETDGDSERSERPSREVHAFRHEDDDRDIVDARDLSKSTSSPFYYEPVARDPDGEDVFVADIDAAESAQGNLINVAVVNIGEGAVVEDCDAGDLLLKKGDYVVIESERGLTLGTIAFPPMRRLMKVNRLHRILRRVNTDDERQQKSNQEREKTAFSYCKRRIRELKLPMKLAKVQYMHNSSKAVIYFAAEERVDFRDFVRDASRSLNARVEMKQVGVRDESKMTGGIGSCGLTLCCSSWLPKFDPVSIRMAKDQNLSLNPQKISGQCGRLKCCLAYEQSLYAEARKLLPTPGKKVLTPDGIQLVQEVDIPRRLVRTINEEGTVETYPANVITKLDPTGKPIMSKSSQDDDREARASRRNSEREPAENAADNATESSENIETET